jgi:hypothetical protein
MVVLKRTAGSAMAISSGWKMIPKVGPRKAKLPPWMMGRRSPNVVWRSVFRPETKKMVEMTSAVSVAVPPMAGTMRIGTAKTGFEHALPQRLEPYFQQLGLAMARGEG